MNAFDKEKNEEDFVIEVLQLSTEKVDTKDTECLQIQKQMWNLQKEPELSV